MIGLRREIGVERAGMATHQPRILVVDDDPAINRMLTRFLTSEGLIAEAVTSGGAMWRKLELGPYDLLILDLRLPGEDGFSLARRLRQESTIALIILSGRCDPVDRIVGLEIGADDYVTKPFEPRELLARIRSVLRRVTGSGAGPRPAGTVLRFGEWQLDLGRRSLTSATGEVVALTTYEFELLAALARRPGRPLSRDTMLGLVANRAWAPDDRSIDVLVGKLRRKLGDNPRGPRLIKTVRGFGYVLACSDA
jgi:DNA-binding response OmpR family regulator